MSSNPDMITIRRATKEDCGSVWRIHIRAIKEICSSHYTQDEIHAWSKVLKPARYKKAINRGAFFVAVDGDVIVGFGNLNKTVEKWRLSTSTLAASGLGLERRSCKPWKLQLGKQV